MISESVRILWIYFLVQVVQVLSRIFSHDILEYSRQLPDSCLTLMDKIVQSGGKKVTAWPCKII